MRKWTSYITIILLVLIVSIISVYPLQYYNRGHENLRIAEGSRLLYEIDYLNSSHSLIFNKIFNERVNNLGFKLNFTPRYYIVLHRNYTEYIGTHFNNRSVYLSERDKVCEIVCERIYLIFNIEKVYDDKILLNVLTSFVNGVAKCGLNYNLIEFSNEFVRQGDFYISFFKNLNLSRKFFILTSNFEVKGGNGECLGEWPFWLKKYDLEQKFAMILYRLEDWVQVMLDNTVDVKGVANIIFLNMSRNSLADYIVGNINLPKYMQIFNYKSIFPQEIIIPNIDKEKAEKIVEERRLAFEQMGRCCGNKELIESTAFPETYEYYNGTLKINSELLIKNVDFKDKPFKFLNSLSIRQEVWRGKDFQVNVYNVYKGIEYDGKNMLHQVSLD
ncbi:MAG: hypothetical protein QXL89_08155 [Nitrososphaeria archaeon]